jgi:hypothetical protein
MVGFAASDWARSSLGNLTEQGATTVAPTSSLPLRGSEADADPGAWSATNPVIPINIGKILRIITPRIGLRR